MPAQHRDVAALVDRPRARARCRPGRRTPSPSARRTAARRPRSGRPPSARRPTARSSRTTPRRGRCVLSNGPSPGGATMGARSNGAPAFGAREQVDLGGGEAAQAAPRSTRPCRARSSRCRASRRSGTGSPPRRPSTGTSTANAPCRRYAGPKAEHERRDRGDGAQRRPATGGGSRARGRDPTSDCLAPLDGRLHQLSQQFGRLARCARRAGPARRRRRRSPAASWSDGSCSSR